MWWGFEEEIITDSPNAISPECVRSRFFNYSRTLFLVKGTYASRSPPCDRSKTCRGFKIHMNICNTLAPYREKEKYKLNPSWCYDYDNNHRQNISRWIFRKLCWSDKTNPIWLTSLIKCSVIGHWQIVITPEQPEGGWARRLYTLFQIKHPTTPCWDPYSGDEN